MSENHLLDIGRKTDTHNHDGDNKLNNHDHNNGSSHHHSQQYKKGYYIFWSLFGSRDWSLTSLNAILSIGSALLLINTLVFAMIFGYFRRQKRTTSGYAKNESVNPASDDDQNQMLQQSSSSEVGNNFFDMTSLSPPPPQQLPMTLTAGNDQQNNYHNMTSSGVMPSDTSIYGINSSSISSSPYGSLSRNPHYPMTTATMMSNNSQNNSPIAYSSLRKKPILKNRLVPSSSSPASSSSASTTAAAVADLNNISGCVKSGGTFSTIAECEGSGCCMNGDCGTRRGGDHDDDQDERIECGCHPHINQFDPKQQQQIQSSSSSSQTRGEHHVMFSTPMTTTTSSGHRGMVSSSMNEGNTTGAGNFNENRNNRSSTKRIVRIKEDPLVHVLKSSSSPYSRSRSGILSGSSSFYENHHPESAAAEHDFHPNEGQNHHRQHHSVLFTDDHASSSSPSTSFPILAPAVDFSNETPGIQNSSSSSQRIMIPTPTAGGSSVSSSTLSPASSSLLSVHGSPATIRGQQLELHSQPSYAYISSSSSNPSGNYGYNTNSSSIMSQRGVLKSSSGHLDHSSVTRSNFFQQQPSSADGPSDMNDTMMMRIVHSDGVDHHHEENDDSADHQTSSSGPINNTSSNIFWTICSSAAAADAPLSISTTSSAASAGPESASSSLPSSSTHGMTSSSLSSDLSTLPPPIPRMTSHYPMTSSSASYGQQHRPSMISYFDPSNSDTSFQVSKHQQNLNSYYSSSGEKKTRPSPNHVLSHHGMIITNSGDNANDSENYHDHYVTTRGTHPPPSDSMAMTTMSYGNMETFCNYCASTGGTTSSHEHQVQGGEDGVLNLSNDHHYDPDGVGGV